MFLNFNLSEIRSTPFPFYPHKEAAAFQYQHNVFMLQFWKKIRKNNKPFKMITNANMCKCKVFCWLLCILILYEFFKTCYLTEHNVVLIWLRLALIILHLWFIRSFLFSVWVRNENIIILKSTVSYFVQVMLNIFPCHQPTLWR